MTKTRCPNCNEFPFRWRWRYDDNCVRGRECSLCGHIRPAKSRMSAKRAKFDALIEELLKEPN